jgi:hypothetical protein
VRKLELQPAGDLLGRPVLPELRRNETAQDRAACELAPLRPPRTLPGAPVGLGGAVAASALMPVELTCDRRGRSAQTGGNPSRRLASSNAARDLLALMKRQREAAPAPLTRSHASAQADRATNRAGRSIERPADLADRLAPPPPLPQLPTLQRRVLPPPPRQRNTSSSRTNRCCADGLTAQRLSSRGRPISGDEVPADRGGEGRAPDLPALHGPRRDPPGFYAWRRRGPSLRSLGDAERARLIVTIYDGSLQTYGAPRIQLELADEHDVHVGRKRVARLMRDLGIEGVSRRGKRRRTTVPDPKAPLAPDLVERRFQAERPDQPWLADLTYVPTLEGYLFLGIVMDMCSRKIVGWSMRDDLKADLVVDALSMAVTRRRPPAGPVHHADSESVGCGWLRAA